MRSFFQIADFFDSRTFRLRFVRLSGIVRLGRYLDRSSRSEGVPKCLGKTFADRPDKTFKRPEILAGLGVDYNSAIESEVRKRLTSNAN